MLRAFVCPLCRTSAERLSRAVDDPLQQMWRTRFRNCLWSIIDVGLTSRPCRSGLQPLCPMVTLVYRCRPSYRARHGHELTCLPGSAQNPTRPLDPQATISRPRPPLSYIASRAYSPVRATAVRQRGAACHQPGEGWWSAHQVGVLGCRRSSSCWGDAGSGRPVGRYCRGCAAGPVGDRGRPLQAARAGRADARRGVAGSIGGRAGDTTGGCGGPGGGSERAVGWALCAAHPGRGPRWCCAASAPDWAPWWESWASRRCSSASSSAVLAPSWAALAGCWWSLRWLAWRPDWERSAPMTGGGRPCWPPPAC